MFFNLSLLVALLTVFLPVKPTGAVCSNGLNFRSIIRDFANNVKAVCQTEPGTIRFVQKHAHNSCCAFDSMACKDAQEIYEYFYTEKRDNPSVHNMCYYNVFVLFFALCDCQSKIHKEPRPNDLSCGVSGLYSIVPFIVGGQKSLQCEFPWMAQYRVGPYLCGGVLVDAKHVLTAAHCAKLDEKSRMTISLSTTDTYNPVLKVGIENVTIHPQYNINYYGYYNDIAILKLSEEVPFTKCLQPICLPKGVHDINETTNCFTAGWGENGLGHLQRYLQKVKVPIMSESVCRRYVRGYQPGHLCAGYLQGGKDACSGDSGGPLMCPVNGQWVLAGLVSFGFKCAKPYHPGVYTDVKYYMSWIMNNLH